ncbi:MAG: hypothetical protein EHM28_13830, partial [Spirochaetaceae bacterium]
MCILIQLPLAGKDFQEPLEVIDPLYPDAKDSSGFLTYGYCDISNTWYVVMNDSSSYYNRVLGAFTLLDINNDFALNAYYSTYLLVGPVLPGETPATAAEFWMNAVQFEYGFTGAARVLGWDIIFEYSRTSQHPLKSEYSQVTTDVLKTGFVAPRLILDNIMAIFWFRTGFVDLFDFW